MNNDDNKEISMILQNLTHGIQYSCSVSKFYRDFNPFSQKGTIGKCKMEPNIKLFSTVQAFPSEVSLYLLRTFEAKINEKDQMTCSILSSSGLW